MLGGSLVPGEVMYQNVGHNMPSAGFWRIGSICARSAASGLGRLAEVCRYNHVLPLNAGTGHWWVLIAVTTGDGLLWINREFSIRGPDWKIVPRREVQEGRLFLLA